MKGYEWIIIGFIYLIGYGIVDYFDLFQLNFYGFCLGLIIWGCIQLFFEITLKNKNTHKD